MDKIDLVMIVAILSIALIIIQAFQIDELRKRIRALEKFLGRKNNLNAS